MLTGKLGTFLLSSTGTGIYCHFCEIYTVYAITHFINVEDLLLFS